MGKTFDCAGWATRANMLCSDGRVIMKNAFKDCDGLTVPLVWNHQHNSIEEVLGHALLENRDDGVYAYCTFNNSDGGQHAKLCVQNGDIKHFSIYANKLKHQGCNVIHGAIREVSLVLAGANPGAYIESVIMHGDDSCEEGEIYSPTQFVIEDYESLFHADSDTQKGEKEVAKDPRNVANDSEETVEDVFNTLTEKQKTVVYALIGQALEGAGGDMKHADDDEDDEDETVEDVFNTLSEKQKTVVYALIGQALEDKESNGGRDDMKHNVFDNEPAYNDFLAHFDMEEVINDAKYGNGSFRDALARYMDVNSLQHGIEDIDMLFPEATNLNTTPEFIKRETGWVGDIMKGVHHTPFSRIRSTFADITENDARAKGYIKGNIKTEEFFSLMKRQTTPTTIYKKQKLDRDDVVDITDFDVIAWLKAEMRLMLDEEIARAILVGDGRNASSQDKINEQNIRPIWTDDDIFTVKSAITVASGMTDAEKAKAFIKATIKSRKHYKGSGNTIMFMTEDMLTECLLLEDLNGRTIYDTEAQLANKLRVKRIVTVPVMENLSRTVGSNKHTLAGIYVDLKDYNVGADKGGAVNMFDDFDIDYNAQKYLIETRCSGALIKPFSAVAVEFVEANA